MEWLKNLSNAIEYIESHLDTEISYEEAARIACCSTYYFQRLFSYYHVGISPLGGLVDSFSTTLFYHKP